MTIVVSAVSAAKNSSIEYGGDTISSSETLNAILEPMLSPLTVLNLNFPDDTWEESETPSWDNVLGQLSNLSSGWDGYSAPAPSRDSVCEGYDILDSLMDSPSMPYLSHVGPSVRGGVGLTLTSRSKEFVVEILNDGRVIRVQIGDDGHIDTKEIHYFDVYARDALIDEAVDFLE